MDLFRAMQELSTVQGGKLQMEAASPRGLGLRGQDNLGKEI